MLDSLVPETPKRIERVLTPDPGMGVVRHIDADYNEAVEFAEKNIEIRFRQ